MAHARSRAMAASFLLLPLLAAPQMTEAADLPRPLTGADFLFQGAVPERQAELGRFLFFDPILSGNRNISCGTCHDPARGTGDGLSLGIGEGGQGAGMTRHTESPVTGRVPRNAQPLYNIGALEYASMFHDGRLEPDPGVTFASGFWSPAREQLPEGLTSLLAAQAMFPVLSPVEMAGQKNENPVGTAVADDRLAGPGGAWDILAGRLRDNPEYATLFADAFEDVNGAQDITFVHAANALAAFQASAFRSHDSPFDHFLAGDENALGADARAGMELFYGAAGCGGCHSGPLLTDHDFHAIAMPQTGPGKGHGQDTSHWRGTGFSHRPEDEGRFRVTFEPQDLFKFRTPSLRNVALTGPWGHSGAYDTLESVVRHHLAPAASLEAFDTDKAAEALPELGDIIEPTAAGSKLVFHPLNPARRDAFDQRDTWVTRSPALRGRIEAANELEPVRLNGTQVDRIVAFLHALTSPDALHPQGIVPAHVPSGLSPQPQAAKPNG